MLPVWFMGCPSPCGIDELTLGYRTLAWSRQGTIASVAADGRSIDLYFIRSHPKDGAWGLSEPTPWTQLGAGFQGGPIAHLAWAATSNPELAVIDTAGRVSIWNFNQNLNRPSQVRSWDSDSIEDVNAVVGCYWLPLCPQSKQYNLLHGPAIREGNVYRYDSTYVHAFGPYHPNPSKSALLCITANGRLKLFFYQNNGRVLETSIELDGISTADETITHAALCSEKSGSPGTLLIALATASRQLRIARALVQWGVPPSDKQGMPPGGQPLNPKLQSQSAGVTTWLRQDAGDSLLDPFLAELSHLEVLPSAVDNPREPKWSPSVVVGVRVGIPASGTAYSQEVQSIIERWEIVTEPSQGSHQAFDQLGSKGSHHPSTQVRCPSFLKMT
jgi:mediator of RNA polymerase II transcription subunit 16, fungi type